MLALSFFVQQLTRVGLKVPLEWEFPDTLRLARQHRGWGSNKLVRSSAMRDDIPVALDCAGCAVCWHCLLACLGLVAYASSNKPAILAPKLCPTL